jgi:hypothetical protein
VDPEYMVFEVVSYQMGVYDSMPNITMKDIDALRAFTHMASVDQRPIPIFKLQKVMPEKGLTHWMYFCIYDGCMICTYKEEKETPAVIEQEVKSDVAVSETV